LENTGGPAKNQEASVPAVSDEVSPVRASLVTRSSWVGGVVPNEISETMFRRLSAMGARNTRDGTWPSEVVKEPLALLVLALKPPEAVINVGETPKVGDRVENEAGQAGTVKGLEFDQGNYELSIKWDEGVFGIRYSITEEFRLITRGQG